MPYTQQGLPWSGRTELSRSCSSAGAVMAERRRGPRTRAYLAWLHAFGPATDHQAAEGLAYGLSSICSIRNALVTAGLVEARDRVLGPHGTPNTRWAVTGTPWAPVAERPRETDRSASCQR